LTINNSLIYRKIQEVNINTVRRLSTCANIELILNICLVLKISKLKRATQYFQLFY